jgi:hypothetical protein
MLFWDLHNNSNTMNPTKLILSAVFLAATKADAVEFPQTPFSHHDWEIACDNTAPAGQRATKLMRPSEMPASC